MHRTYYPPIQDEQETILLSPMQSLVLERVLAGYMNGKIGAELQCSVDTVKAHVRNLMAKAGASNRTHLAALVYSGAVRVLVPVGESYV